MEGGTPPPPKLLAMHLHRPLLAALTLLASSCASIMTGHTDEILVTSTPEGAWFRTSHGHEGQTPARVSVADDEPLWLTFELEGHRAERVEVGTHLSLWAIGNAFTWGIIGLWVDAAGDGRVHDTDHVHAELRRTAARPVAPESESESETPQAESFDQWLERQSTGDGDAPSS